MKVLKVTEMLLCLVVYRFFRFPRCELTYYTIKLVVFVLLFLVLFDSETQRHDVRLRGSKLARG